MDGTDPESEALIWKLHRELNGLTRTSRRSAPVEFVSLHNPARSDSRRDKNSNASRLRRTAAAEQSEPGDSSKRQAGSPEDSSQRGSKKKKTEYHDDAGSKDVTTKHASSAAPAKSEPPPFSRNTGKKQVPRSNSSHMEEGSLKRPATKGHDQPNDEPQVSKGRSCASDGTHSKKLKPHAHPKPSNDTALPPSSTNEPRTSAPTNSDKPKRAASPAYSPPPEAPQPTHPTPTPHTAAASTPPAATNSKQQQSDGPHQWQAPCNSHPLGGSQVKLEGSQVKLEGSQVKLEGMQIKLEGSQVKLEGMLNREGADPRFQQLPAEKGSMLAAAAAAAASMVKEKARAIKNGASDGGRTLKCFHAGVRWGIALKSQDIQSRADLAQKLNDAFAGEILSCGRGDALHVIFVDSDGLATEFPSLRSTHVKESQARWQAMVEKAVKIYVRRS